MEKTQQFDFIAIGDTVIDAFIKISAGHIQETAHGREICLPYGMKVPFDEVYILPAVGNSANASVSAARLGLTSALLTSLGKDAHGDECLTQLTNENVAVDFIRQEEGKKTNYHYVLWKDDDRTILIKHEKFTPVIPNIGSPKWLYLSSLGGHTLPFHHELVEYVKSHPDIKLAFQPGTGELWSTEHGWNSRDELNIIKKGGNYGWHIREGFIGFNPEDERKPPAAVHDARATPRP